MTETLRLLDEVGELLRGLEGTRVNIETNNKNIRAAKAEANRGLLYAAHLADMVRIDIMSNYHRFKGEDPPLIRT